MYQYKARLKSSQKIIHEGHTIEDIEQHVVGWKRREPARANESIEVLQIKRDQLKGVTNEKVVKIL